MGSRIGFCVEKTYKDITQRSPIYRQQWAGSIPEIVESTWKTLSNGLPVDDGMQAIRSDLNTGRTIAALVYANYEPPFESIAIDVNCDISDNGLVIIDITNYKNWEVNHVDIDFEKEELKETKQIIGKIQDGKFEWSINAEDRSYLGEGLK